MWRSRNFESCIAPLRWRNHNLLAVARFLREALLCVADAVVEVRAREHNTRKDQLDREDKEGHKKHQ